MWRKLMEHGKQFFIVGSKNAITYKDVFQLIEDNRPVVRFSKR